MSGLFSLWEAGERCIEKTPRALLVLLRTGSSDFLGFVCAGTHLAYQNGQVTQASLNQSASQSTETSTYLRGKRVADTTTPSESSKTSDLLALLKPLLQDNQKSGNTARWQQALSKIHDQIFLQAVPASLNSST